MAAAGPKDIDGICRSAGRGSEKRHFLAHNRNRGRSGEVRDGRQQRVLACSPVQPTGISRQAWAYRLPGGESTQAFEVAASSPASRFPSCSRFISASTISRIIISKLISGTQPSFFLALDASPRKVSTSAGR